MLSRIKSKFAQSIKNKRINIFLFFFLVSFLILVFTKFSEIYLETVPFSVKFKNIPETTIITMDSVPDIEVTLSTHGFNLLSYYFQNKIYQLNFETDVTKQGDHYVWTANKGTLALQKQLGKSVKIIGVKPDSLFFPFGTLSEKKVPVVLDSKFDYASGYDTLNGFELDPDSVTIIGSANEIAKIKSIETKPLELKEIRSNIDETVALDFSQASKQLKLSEKIVNVRADVEKFTEGTLDIPITILNLPEDEKINYFPKQITVAYYISLKLYKEIKPSDFIIECDFKQAVKTGNSFFTPHLIINSKKVKSAKMKQNKVEYIFIK
ncbi:MAG: YbbR-like domain-containing protein [Psychroserpens sp.]|uniref:CdaR family protein n=1 Tax=Psychroserpens sp. TaxID=2020870 RepID=UPI003C789053